MTEANPTHNTVSVRPVRNMLLAGLASLAVATPAAAQPTEPVPAQAAGLGDCAEYAGNGYHNHELEVCTAYVFNSAQKALRLFYKFGNNRIGYLEDPARHHFETRYWGGARRNIEGEVDLWPRTSHLTGNSVKGKVEVASVKANLKADRALLRTRESWKVTDSDDDVLRSEPRHNKNITMCRGKLPGHILHAWLVVKFARDPDFDCIAFDRRNGLKP